MNVMVFMEIENAKTPKCYRIIEAAYIDACCLDDRIKTTTFILTFYSSDDS